MSSQLYSREVNEIPMLSAEEQHELACRFARERDPDDAHRLMLANLRLVLSIASSMGGVGREDRMDLVQEGNAGLLVAIDRFDPTRGLKLSAYASIWIRAFIMRHLMEAGRVVRSTTTREGRRRFFDRTLPRDVSLDASAGSDRDGARAPLLDFVPADEGLRPDIAAEAREAQARLRAGLARLRETLSARDRIILESRLLCDSPQPLRQVGRKLALSGERVRQLERDLLHRLRAFVARAHAESLGMAA